MTYAIIFVGFCVLLAGQGKDEIRGVALIGACLTAVAALLELATR